MKKYKFLFYVNYIALSFIIDRTMIELKDAKPDPLKESSVSFLLLKIIHENFIC